MNANCGLTTIAGAPHTFTPCFFAAASNRCPAEREFAIGFSLQTCLPAATAWRLSRSCSFMSVRFTNKSNGAAPNAGRRFCLRLAGLGRERHPGQHGSGHTTHEGPTVHVVLVHADPPMRATSQRFLFPVRRPHTPVLPNPPPPRALG